MTITPPGTLPAPLRVALDAREPRMTITVTEDTGTAGIDAVRDIADWLGVEARYRNGCWIAQCRFQGGRNFLIVEAVYVTPVALDALGRIEDIRKAAGSVHASVKGTETAA